jgi:hypothetical protein
MGGFNRYLAIKHTKEESLELLSLVNWLILTK